MEQHHEYDGNGSQALHIGTKAAISRWSSCLVPDDWRGIDGDRHSLLSESAAQGERFPHSPTRASDHRPTIVSAQRAPPAGDSAANRSRQGDSKCLQPAGRTLGYPIICPLKRMRLQRSDINAPTRPWERSGRRLRRSRPYGGRIGNAEMTLLRTPATTPPKVQPHLQVSPAEATSRGGRTIVTKVDGSLGDVSAVSSMRDRTG